MSNIVFVEIFNGLEKLLHYVGGLGLADEFVLDDVFEELATFAKFKHEEAHIVPLPNFVQLDDVRMVQLLQDDDLVDKSLQILDYVFLDGLDGHFLLGFTILGLVNNSETASCQLILKVILVLDPSLESILKQTLVVLNRVLAVRHEIRIARRCAVHFLKFNL